MTEFERRLRIVDGGVHQRITFFHYNCKVFVHDLLEHLAKSSMGLHDLDIVALRLNIILLYKIAANMPDFILAMAFPET